MKHKITITLILLSMFLATQFIGLFVTNAYAPSTPTEINKNPLPYGLEISSEETAPIFPSLILSFLIAFGLVFLLMKYKWKNVIKIWFFFVITMSLAISINAFLKLTSLSNISTIAIITAAILTLLKMFKPNVYIHNATELFIYPGIAAIFIPILTPITAITLLILISIYDAWAVWQSGIMQKMAKFQMNEIKIFGGFLIPSASKSVKKKIRKIRTKYKGKKIPKSIKNKKFKIKMAILGGGDVVFPIITAGVFMRAYSIVPALFIIFGSFAGLLSIFISSKKDKAYPAMPYITTGIFIGLILWKIFF